MDNQVLFHHVAVQCEDKNEVFSFYQDLLGLTLRKSFILSKELSQQIFNVKKEIEVMAFKNASMYLEVFLYSQRNHSKCNHIGILVDHLPEFIKKCDDLSINWYNVKKGEKILWFIKDHSGNIFEIKQR